MADVGGLANHRYLIHDRDGKYCPAFDEGRPGRWCEAGAIAPTQPESECVCGALGAIGEGRVPREADSGRRTGATNRVARVRRTLPRRAEPPREGQPPPLSVRGDGPARARAMPRASRGPPEVLLPTGHMSFLTTRGSAETGRVLRTAERFSHPRGADCHSGLCAGHCQVDEKLVDANRQDHPHLPMRYDTGRPRAVIRATQKAASFPWRKARASGPRQQARPQRPPCAKPQQHAQCPRPQARLPEVGLDDPPKVNTGGTRDQVDEAVLLLPAFAKPPDHGATRTGAPTMMHYQPFIDDPAHLETLFVLPPGPGA